MRKDLRGTANLTAANGEKNYVSARYRYAQKKGKQFARGCVRDSEILRWVES